jgi:signal transduction histidine kinase
MILARFLTLVLSLYLLNQLFRAARWRGRNPFVLWQRSFSLKLAAFMFLTSVLPTMTLGYFLIQSIQKNQTREATEIARSKIMAAKGVFASLGVRMDQESAAAYRDPDIEDQVVRRFYREHPRHFPLDRFARALGEDLSLFFSGRLVKTNQPEVFRMGLIERRLDFNLVRELVEDKQSFTLRRHQMPSGLELITAYSSFKVGPHQEAILSMTLIPFSQRQQLRWMEQLEFAGTVLIGLLFLMAGLTQVLAHNVLQPVQAITRAAARMARGLKNQPIVIDREDELKAMISAFNTMQQKIEASKKKLQEQLALQSETFKSMSSGLIGLDQNGVVVLHNNKVFELLQIEDEVSTLEDLVKAQAALTPVGEAFAKDEVGTFELTVGEGNDERSLLATTRTPVFSEISRVRLIMVVEDITATLAASRFEAWSEMARRVAHEIKNPLTPIRLEIDHLLAMHRDQHPAFDEALLDAAEEIKRQVEHLRATATEFSDYARPISLEPEPTDLVPLIEDLVSPYVKTMPQMDISVEAPQQLIALVDARIFRRALHNLVVNAIQAMKQEGRLRVVMAESDNGIDISIEDNGPGIEEALQQKIFEAYFSTKDTGSGLGLVIARRYIVLHEGSLSIDGNYREGTRFVIHLPQRK